MVRYRHFAAAAVIATLVAGSALAQRPRGGGQGRGGPGVGGVAGIPLAALNLPQAQQDLVTDIRQRSREQTKEIQQRLRTAEQASRRAIQTVPLNEALVRTTTLAAAEIEAELAVAEARSFNEIFAALTPEQQAQVKKFQADRADKPEPRRTRSQ